MIKWYTSSWRLRSLAPCKNILSFALQTYGISSMRIRRSYCLFCGCHNDILTIVCMYIYHRIMRCLIYRCSFAILQWWWKLVCNHMHGPRRESISAVEVWCVDHQSVYFYAMRVFCSKICVAETDALTAISSYCEIGSWFLVVINGDSSWNGGCMLACKKELSSRCWGLKSCRTHSRHRGYVMVISSCLAARSRNTLVYP